MANERIKFSILYIKSSFNVIKRFYKMYGVISYLAFLYMNMCSFFSFFNNFLRFHIKVTYQFFLLRGKTHSVNTLFSFVARIEHQLLLSGFLLSDEHVVFRNRRICDSWIHQVSVCPSIFGP